MPRLFLLGFYALWFGLILPGHRRGIVTLPGSAPSVPVISTNGPQLTPPCHQNSAPAKRPVSSNNCAVCFHMALLDTPIVIDHDLNQFVQLHISPPDLCETVFTIDHPWSVSSRAPPV